MAKLACLGNFPQYRHDIMYLLVFPKKQTIASRKNSVIKKGNILQKTDDMMSFLSCPKCYD